MPSLVATTSALARASTKPNEMPNKYVNIAPVTQTRNKSQNAQKTPFQCSSGSCDSMQKTFTYREEIELHNKFFHGTGPSAQAQWLDQNIFTFNVEGYKRNKFYLSNIIKKYKPLICFLQETWFI